MVRQQTSTEVDPQHVGFAGVLGVVGSVCGAIVADTAQTLAKAHPVSPHWNLLGIVAGAVLPLLVGGAGAYWRLRLTVGIAVTVMAIVVGYGGLAVAADVPALKQVVPSLPATTTHVDIQVEPEGTLGCTAAACAREVTIRSTGTAPLMIDKIEFDGPAAEDFGQTGQCEYTQLAPGAECSLRVRFTPSGAGDTRRARLVVNQNLPGLPSYVTLEGKVPRTQMDLTPSPGGASCGYLRANGRDQMQVRFPLVKDGAEPDKTTVAITARADLGATVSYDALVGLTTFTIPIRLAHENEIVVTVDPANEFAEHDEGNNTMLVTITPPVKLVSPVSLDCRFERA